MKDKTENILEFPFLKKNAKSLKRNQIIDRSIVRKNKDTLLNIKRDNEWEQEYYIIYNSYVLDRS